MKDLLKKSNPILFLFLIIVLGYWQVSFFASALKWDLIDVVFPFRYHFSECIQSGYFPFWNPYLQTGTPFFADLQAPTFYPELLYTSLIGGYGIYTMHLLFVMYVFISAFGMYQLSFHFNQNKNASYLAAISYSFCGFLIGHGQHLFLLVGAAWIPFVLLNYLQLHKNRSFTNVLKTAVFVFLMISGAYQALSFTLMYLLLLIFVYFVLVEFRKRNYAALWEFVKTNFYLLLLVVLFSLPLIVSTFEILSSVDRLESGISLEQSVSSGLNFKSFISFIIPHSTLHHNAFFEGADLSMRNHYFGLIPLLFFLLAILKKRSFLEYVILGFGALIFVTSFGSLPFRELMFKYVPLMNLFKYAAYLRIFGLLVFILLAANYFVYFQKNIEYEQVKIKYFLLVFSIGIIALITYSARNVKLTELLGNLSFWGNALMQSLFQLLVIILFFILLTFRKKTKLFFQLVLVLITAEIVLAAQLNMTATVTDKENKPFELKKNLELLPKGFPIPTNSKIKYNNVSGELPTPFWRNTANFTKQVSFKSFSSFELKSYNKLDDDYPNLKNATLNNRLFYFSDKIFQISEFNDADIDELKHSKHLFLSNTDFENLKNQSVKVNSNDKIEVLMFSPNKVELATTTFNTQFLTMLQTNFKGWKAFIDDEEIPIYTSNFNYRTIVLPEGNHRVVFEYKNNKILILYILSNFLFFTTILFLFGRYFKNKYPTRKIYLLVPALFVILILVLLLGVIMDKPENRNSKGLQAEKWDKTNSEFSTSLNSEIEIRQNSEYTNLAKFEVKKDGHGTLVVKAQLYPSDFSEAVLVSDVPGREKSAWNGMKVVKQIEYLNTWNDIIYQRNFFDLSAGEQIQVYVWNNKRNEFKMDSVSVEFYPF